MNNELARWKVQLIPVSGPGSRRAVMCHFCNQEGPVAKKNRKSTSGFHFVTGHIIKDDERYWKLRSLGDNIICHDCYSATTNWG